MTAFLTALLTALVMVIIFRIARLLIAAAPEGYEDETGFHYGRKDKRNDRN